MKQLPREERDDLTAEPKGETTSSFQELDNSATAVETKNARYQLVFAWGMPSVDTVMMLIQQH